MSDIGPRQPQDHYVKICLAKTMLGVDEVTPSTWKDKSLTFGELVSSENLRHLIVEHEDFTVFLLRSTLRKTGSDEP